MLHGHHVLVQRHYISFGSRGVVHVQLSSCEPHFKYMYNPWRSYLVIAPEAAKSQSLWTQGKCISQRHSIYSWDTLPHWKSQEAYGRCFSLDIGNEDAKPSLLAGHCWKSRCGWRCCVNVRPKLSDGAASSFHHNWVTVLWECSVIVQWRCFKNVRP